MALSVHCFCWALSDKLCRIAVFGRIDLAAFFWLRHLNCLFVCLLLCPQDPALRPNAQELLQHEWIQYHRRTLRSSWTRAQGYKTRGGRSTDAHESVNSVISRILHAEGSEDDPALTDGAGAAAVPAADSVGPATPTLVAAAGATSSAAAVRTVDAASGPLATRVDTPGSVVLMRDGGASSSSLEQEAYHPQQQQQQRMLKEQASSSSSSGGGRQQQQVGRSIELSSSKGAVRDGKTGAAAAGSGRIEGPPGAGPGSREGAGLSRAAGQAAANGSSSNLAAADRPGGANSQQQQQESPGDSAPSGTLAVPMEQQQEGPPGGSGGSSSSGHLAFIGQQLRYAPAAAHTPRVGSSIRSGSLMEVPESPLSKILARLHGDANGCETPASAQHVGGSHLLAWLEEAPGGVLEGAMVGRRTGSSSREFGRATSPFGGGSWLGDLSVSSRASGGDSLAGVEGADGSLIMESRRKVGGVGGIIWQGGS